MAETRNRDRLLLLVSVCLFLATLAIIGAFLLLSPIPFGGDWSVLIAGIGFFGSSLARTNDQCGISGLVSGNPVPRGKRPLFIGALTLVSSVAKFR
jgi:hypothetical protein